MEFITPEQAKQYAVDKSKARLFNDEKAVVRMALNAWISQASMQGQFSIQLTLPLPNDYETELLVYNYHHENGEIPLRLESQQQKVLVCKSEIQSMETTLLDMGYQVRITTSYIEISWY